MIYRLLIDVVGDENLVKERYPLPIVPSSDKQVRHYTGILGKHGATVTVADEESHKEICIDKQTVFEGNCTNVKAVHVFTEKQMPGKETAAAIIGPELYAMVTMIAGDEDKLKALQEYACLRADRKATIKRFMLDADFREAMINYLAYYASARLAEKCIGSLEQLTNHYNSRFVRMQPIDMYRVESLLDLIGEKLYLSENASTPYISWPSFLSAVAITRQCSVFDEAYDRPGVILLNLPERVCIPTHWYTALLTETGISELITDVMKHSGRGEKKTKGDQLLLRILWSVDCLSKKDLNRVLKRLFHETVSDHLLTTLKYLPENPAIWEEVCCEYIERVHGSEYAQTVRTIVAAERERINRSLGIGGVIK